MIFSKDQVLCLWAGGMVGKHWDDDGSDTSALRKVESGEGIKEA